MTKSEELIELENKHGAHNYHPLPVVLDKGEGVYVWDVEGKKYFDFLSAYSAVNQGHCHPKITEALVSQANKLCLTSRAFYNSVLGEYEKYITELFEFDKVLPMNSGAEAVETAIKLCRKWAYERKGIPENQAKIIVCEGNFHGRTSTIISFSNDQDARKNYGPYTPGFVTIPYNDVEALKSALQQDNIAGFLVEPIQGEAGVYTPHEDFIMQASALCQSKNVLFIADEVQTGIARTGSLLAVCGNCNCSVKCEKQESYIKPDILILGKALSGGMYPVSAVLADNDIMMVIQPGQHGSTFGGNPIACKVAMTALQVVFDEKLISNARYLGELFRNEINRIIGNSNLVSSVRGKGLLIGIQLHIDQTNFIKKLMDNKLLTIRAAENVVRVLPPLNVKKNELDKAIKIIDRVCVELI